MYEPPSGTVFWFRVDDIQECEGTQVAVWRNRIARDEPPQIAPRRRWLKPSEWRELFDYFARKYGPTQ